MNAPHSITQAAADAIMAEKVKALEPDQWIQFEKQMLIQQLDNHWKEHLSTLDALRQVIYLRSYAQKKPIDEYKHEAFAQFERMLSDIRVDVTRILAHANFNYAAPEDFGDFDMPDFVTTHIDPLTGDDDSYDIDAGTGNIMSRLPPMQIAQPDMPQGAEGELLEKVSRNAPCPCGSGNKYKHCHGQLG